MKRVQAPFPMSVPSCMAAAHLARRHAGLFAIAVTLGACFEVPEVSTPLSEDESTSGSEGLSDGPQGDATGGTGPTNPPTSTGAPAEPTTGDDGAGSSGGDMDGTDPTCSGNSCGPGLTCVDGQCLEDADEDAIPDDIDCDPADDSVSNTAQRSCRSDCAPGFARCSDGVWGECDAPTECTCASGQTRELACGNCGIQLQECSALGQWDNLGGCADQGVCSPSAVQYGLDCGDMCGTQRQECSSQCQWNGWTCENEGSCQANDEQEQQRDCGSCGQTQTRTRRCSSGCEWNTWGPWSACPPDDCEETTNDTGPGGCEEVCCGGPGTADSCQAFELVSGLRRVADVKVVDGDLYFLEEDDSASVVDLDTRNVEVISTGPVNSNNFVITDTDVCWSRQLSSGGVHCAPLTAGATTVYDLGPFVRFTAIDNGVVYGSRLDGVVARAQIGQTTINEDIASTQGTATGLTVVGPRIYIATGTGGTIDVAVLTTGQATTLIDVGTTVDRVVSDSSFLYYVTTQGDVFRATLTGGDVTQLADHSGGVSLGLALHDDRLFWTNQNDGAVYAVNTDGTNEQLIDTTDGSNPRGIDADDRGVYWGTYWDQTEGSGTVMMRPHSRP